MLIRRSGERWHAPASESFDDEATLELLLKESPDLLPGAQGAPIAVVSQLYIPETGPADLIAVSTRGSITVVECKLKANPEIRRNVVGQVFAYASGLWKMRYDEFDELYAKRAGLPLAEHVRAAAEKAAVDFDEEAFRTAIASALAQGDVGMVIAVDSITDELRRTVEFVNSHTVQTVDLLALALRYVKDGEVEVLVPTLYGDEAVREKVRHSTRQWTEPDLLAALTEYVEPLVAKALLRIYDSTKHYPAVETPAQKLEGGHFYWGTGRYPSVSAWYLVEGRAVCAWSVYTEPGRTVFAINFEWIARNGISEDRLVALVAAMRSIPGVGPHYSGSPAPFVAGLRGHTDSRPSRRRPGQDGHADLAETGLSPPTTPTQEPDRRRFPNPPRRPTKRHESGEIGSSTGPPRKVQETHYSDLEAKGWRKRPSLPVDTLLADPTAADVIVQALAELVG
jgi:hypothetical protein